MSKNLNAVVAHQTLTPATAERQVLAAIGDPDALARLAKTVGGAYVAGGSAWSLVAARITFEAERADVYGDTRGKDSTARMSVTDYGRQFQVTGPRVAQWHRGGRALSLGATAEDVAGYLRAPGKHHAETIDAGLSKGKADHALFVAAQGKADAEREARKVASKAAKDKAKTDAENGTVSVKGEVTTVTVTNIIAAITAAITAADAAAISAYVTENGTETRDEFVSALREFADTVAATEPFVSEDTTEDAEVPAA